MQPYYDDGKIQIFHGDAREILPTLPDESFDAVITSPPYNLGGEPWPHLGNWRPGHWSSGGKGITKWRNGSDACNGIQYGLHKDNMPWPEYVAWAREMLTALWVKLTPAGCIFLNHKPRVIGSRLWTPLELIPPDVILRQIVVWARPGGINYNATALVPTHEWVMLLAKEPFRLKSKAAAGLGDVWYLNLDKNIHPAPFPLALPVRCLSVIKAAAVLDPFCGSGTTLIAARDAGIRGVGIEVDERWCEVAAKRLSQQVFEFSEPATDSSAPVCLTDAAPGAVSPGDSA